MNPYRYLHVTSTERKLAYNTMAGEQLLVVRKDHYMLIKSDRAHYLSLSFGRIAQSNLHVI